METRHEPAALATLREQRLISVIRAPSAASAEAAARAIAKGGFRLIEIAFTVPEAARVMAALASEPDLIVGAGTVLTARQADAALAAGARFLIAPNTTRPVAEAALAAGVMYCPGAYTTNEILHALDLGAHLVKVYPVGVAGGPAYIRVIRDPLPEAPLLAAGGTTLDNMLPFLSAGCIGVGLGASLCDPELVKANRMADLTHRAREFMERLDQAFASGTVIKSIA